MTNANQKEAIRRRMAETGESYMQARRRLMEIREGRAPVPDRTEKEGDSAQN